MAKKNIFGAIWNVWFVHRIANGHCREIKLCPYCPRQIFFSYMFGGARRATEKYGQSGSDICQLVAGKVIKMLIFDEIGHFLGTKFQFALSKYSKKIYWNINFFSKVLQHHRRKVKNYSFFDRKTTTTIAFSTLNLFKNTYQTESLRLKKTAKT